MKWNPVQFSGVFFLNQRLDPALQIIERTISRERVFAPWISDQAREISVEGSVPGGCSPTRPTACLQHAGAVCADLMGRAQASAQIVSLHISRCPTLPIVAVRTPREADARIRGGEDGAEGLERVGRGTRGAGGVSGPAGGSAASERGTDDS